eukprot:snap_masked-scaffold_26-processed-gene-2.32-mRNA-1 protein AED:0.00 eAED:0.00 QI:0/-1/0/1/-1/1/1/0/840
MIKLRFLFFKPVLLNKVSPKQTYTKNVVPLVRSMSSFNVAQQQQAEDWRKNMTGVDEDFLTGARNESWWTGPSPSILSGKSVSSLKQPLLDNVTKKEVVDYFDNTWLTTEILFSGLQGEEAFYRPPYHNLRHPLIFYYGHPITFYINKLRVAKLLPHGIDAHFEDIFEVGVDEMRWDDISTESKDWPSVREVRDYRVEAYKTVRRVIDEQFGSSDEATRNISWETQLWSLMMGIEHEKIHIETSSVLFRELPKKLLRYPEHFPAQFSLGDSSQFEKPVEGKNYPRNDLVQIQGASVKIGKDVDFPTYGWDNEYGKREIRVADFQVSQFKVTNGQYYEFVSSGGYVDKKYWSKDGWGWRTFRNQKWPYFWKQTGPAGSHEYALRGIFETRNMEWDLPVCVNYHESQAYTNWLYEKDGFKGPKYRILTEAEHIAMRSEAVVNDPLRNDPTLTQGSDNKATLNLKVGSEYPVDTFAPNEKGIYDEFGNVWEWLEDDMNPLRNDVHPYYDDFTAPCYDGEHTMLMGGSFITCGDAGANSFSRFHFRPHFLQHSGFRVVIPSKEEPNIKGEGIATFLGNKSKYSAVDLLTEQKSNNVYETNELLNQYLSLHFGQKADVLDTNVRKHENRRNIEPALDFPSKTADLLLEFLPRQDLRMLDIGCSVGGASIRLAESSQVSEVVGFDFSESFVNCAEDIIQNKGVSYRVPIFGEEYSEEMLIPTVSSEVAGKVTFLTHDATKLLDLNQGKFDGVLMANLLCRLPEPMNLLQDLGRIMNKDGVALFLSPFSWLEEFTAKEKWISPSMLKNIMASEGFVEIYEKDVPLLIREHERKYQYIVSQALAFRKI